MTDILWGQILTSTGAKTVIKTSGSCATDVENEVNLGLYLLVVLWLWCVVIISQVYTFCIKRYIHNHPRKNARCCKLLVLLTWSEGKWLDAPSWKPAAMALCRFMFLLSTVSFADEEAMEKTLESHGFIWDMLCSLCLDAWTSSNIWATNESNIWATNESQQRTEMEGHSETQWQRMCCISAVRIKFQCRFCRQVAPACQFLQTGLHVSGAMAMHEKRNESAAIANGICLSALSDQDLLYFCYFFRYVCWFPQVA